MTLGKFYATLGLSLHIGTQGLIWLIPITSALGGWDSMGHGERAHLALGRARLNRRRIPACKVPLCSLSAHWGVGDLGWAEKRRQESKQLSFGVSHTWYDSWLHTWLCVTLDKCLLHPELQSSHL